MRDEGTRFGGLAGRTVLHFLTPAGARRVVSAAALLAVIAAATGVVFQLLRLPLALTLFLSTVAMSPLVGRLTLAAKEGDLEAGVTSPTPPGAVRGFVLRYAVLNGLWEFPVAITGGWLAGNAMPALHANASTPLPERGLWLGGALVLLAAVAIVASVAAHVIAARASTLAACFTPEPWQWLGARRGDLPLFVAALLGTPILLLILEVPPLVLLGAVLSRASPQVAAVVMGVGLVVCWSSVPVFVSRLTGAFAMDVEALGADAVTAAASAHAAVETLAAPSAAPAQARPAPSAVDLRRALAGIAARAATDLQGALADAEALEVQAPGEATVSSQLTALYLRAQRIGEALACGARAIARAVEGGNGKIACEVFGALREHRKGLALEDAGWQGLARALVAQASFADAAWCYVQFGAAGTDPLRCLKGLVSVADAAGKAGQAGVAANIHLYVIKTAPRSPSAEYCRAALERLQRVKAKPAS
ncbi:MAG TPA: hypothetical protein VLU43_07735 [Anaeromyxobacteraceae bacterium]|nr:hypothetical protein [Anaeromyxobacteraceae bacterium]